MDAHGEEQEAVLRERIHPGMRVLGMDGGELGRVFEVGVHALALERGTFLPREWRVTLAEVDHVDERGVWIRNGAASLERVSDAFSGPAEPYRAAADASPIHRWTGFAPPAVDDGDESTGTPDDGAAHEPPRGD